MSKNFTTQGISHGVSAILVDRCMLDVTRSKPKLYLSLLQDPPSLLEVPAVFADLNVMFFVPKKKTLTSSTKKSPATLKHVQLAC